MTSPSTPPIHDHQADGTTQHFALTTDRSFTVHVHNTDGVPRIPIPASWIDRAMDQLKPSEFKLLLWLARHANAQGQVHRPGKSRLSISVLREREIENIHIVDHFGVHRGTAGDMVKALEESGYIAERTLRRKGRTVYWWWLLYPNSEADSAHTDSRPTEVIDRQIDLFDAPSEPGASDEPTAPAPGFDDSAVSRLRRLQTTAPPQPGAGAAIRAPAPEKPGAGAAAPEVRGGGMGGAPSSSWNQPISLSHDDDERRALANDENATLDEPGGELGLRLLTELPNNASPKQIADALKARGVHSGFAYTRAQLGILTPELTRSVLLVFHRQHDRGHIRNQGGYLGVLIDSAIQGAEDQDRETRAAAAEHRASAHELIDQQLDKLPDRLLVEAAIACRMVPPDDATPDNIRHYPTFRRPVIQHLVKHPELLDAVELTPPEPKDRPSTAGLTGAAPPRGGDH